MTFAHIHKSILYLSARTYEISSRAESPVDIEIIIMLLSIYAVGAFELSLRARILRLFQARTRECV